MMKAREVMTKDVVSVRPDTPISQVARVLAERGISAVPVIEENGALIGMVSEGDLIGRAEAERDRRREWWLECLAEGTGLAPTFLESIRTTHRPARSVMVAPVTTVDEEKSVEEIAQLLTNLGIKRVPVVREGRVVGIVSRADLVRALAAHESS
jgi:CBS domain-containing protein